MEKEKKKDPLITRKSVHGQKDQPKKGSRLTEKEQGRRLDVFYNWGILLVGVAIILVFVLAFFI